MVIQDFLESYFLNLALNTKALYLMNKLFIQCVFNDLWIR